MKRFSQLFILPFIFLPLFFSCGHKAGNEAAAQSDTLKLKNDSLKATADSSGLKKEEKKTGNATSWSVNEQTSKVDFTIKNFGKDVHGTLSGVKATIHFDKNNLKGSSFDADVKVNTINTGIGKRDRDLMNPKYFDEANHHDITFKSDSITAAGNGYKTVGTLTIKGKSLRKEIPFTFEEKGNTGIFKSQFTLQRLDYGIGGDGPIMGKDVNVSLEITTEKK